MYPTLSGTSDADILRCDRELQLHLESLGLTSVEDYREWCVQNGFSPRIDKHWHDRCKERYFASRDAIKRRVTREKTEKRKPRRTIQRIFAGELDEKDLTQPNLVLVFQTAARVGNEPARDAFLQLLLHVEGTGLLTTRPAFPQLGAQDGNSFIEGLLGLARNRRQWIRPLPSWKPRSHNLRRQFSSLAAHLLAEYRVPLFMDSVWFLGDSPEAARQQAWYVALGNGQSPRKLDLPITLTKWHARLRKEPEKPQLEWEESGIGLFDWTEGLLASSNLRRWTIIELLSRKALYHEGQVMRHCVASYDNSCSLGGTSIWSLGVERNLGRRKRVLTIELASGSKTICQIRGKANRLPDQKEMDIVRRWASQEGLSLPAHLGSP